MQYFENNVTTFILKFHPWPQLSFEGPRVEVEKLVNMYGMRAFSEREKGNS